MPFLPITQRDRRATGDDVAIYRLGDHIPSIHETAFVASEATLIGQVTIEAGASVWPGAILRGDNEPIVIGENSNVQDGAVLHSDPGFPLTIGPGVTIGHQAMLHGCTIESNVLIGIQAIVLNGAHIEADTLVGAGAVVTEGKRFGPGVLVVGSPAQTKRELSPEQIEGLRKNTAHYVERCKYYKENLQRVG
jgi:carbonic anhydrase/acetyltransferase-like protein (isoleucine patch superfamily)